MHCRLVLQGQIHPALGQKCCLPCLACQCLHLLSPPPLPKEQAGAAQSPLPTLSQERTRLKALSLGWKEECTNRCISWVGNEQGIDSCFCSCYESTSKAVGGSTTPHASDSPPDSLPTVSFLHGWWDMQHPGTESPGLARWVEGSST